MSIEDLPYDATADDILADAVDRLRETIEQKERADGPLRFAWRKSGAPERARRIAQSTWRFKTALEEARRHRRWEMEGTESR